MKHLKLFETFNKHFELPYQEVSETEFTNWYDSHTTQAFKKSDTLTILEIINSLWSKVGLEMSFYRNKHKVQTPIKTLYKNNQVWDVSDDIFTREEFDTIEAYDHHHFLEITKWEDEWYTVFYDTYGGGHPHHFIIDTQDGIDWIQDKISTIYSDVYEGDVDESVQEDTIFEDLSDLFITEMSNWDSKEIEDDSVELKRIINQYSDKDFIWRIRPAYFTGISRAEFRFCLDIQYNINIWENSTGKTGARLIHGIYKFTRQCVRRYGLTVFPKGKDMSNYDTFGMNIQHFHTMGEIRVYLGFEDPEKHAIKKMYESNMPQRFEADDGELGVIKWSNFKEKHPAIDLTPSQIQQIAKLLDIRKFNWKVFNGQDESHPDSLIITYNKWTEHTLPQYKSGYNKYQVHISAHEDEWFTISEVNYHYGYSDLYLADQFDQVLNFVKSLVSDTPLDANPFDLGQF